ncbi:hypothetical protein CDAR_587121 [Caerostris darwini]|uniref:Uncharacterized protein n=1 Tax=Caerostris darwini TaxID=1538125 RepID=A0AAV4T154_9ARAC|nr:hypothetical protein CDAR_587121 [Caerostris darwini]
MDVLKSAVPSSPTMFGDRTEAFGPMEFNVLQVLDLIQLVIRPDREILISPEMEVNVDYLMEFTWIFQIIKEIYGHLRPWKVFMDVLRSAVPSSPSMFGDRTEASGPLDFNVLQVFHLIHLVIRPDREISISPKMEGNVAVDYLMELTRIFQIIEEIYGHIRTEASGPLDFNVLQVFHLIHLVIRPDREISISPKMEGNVAVDYLMELTRIFQIIEEIYGHIR